MEQSEKLYTIGQISSMCNIPIKTLRYYDEIGLLQPEKTDEFSHYRYYTKNHILLANIIKHFKSSGFSLEDIRILLKREDVPKLLKMLEDKLLQTKQRIKELDYLREKLETDIYYMKAGKAFSEYLENENETWDRKGIELKIIPATPVIYTRYRCPSNPGSYIQRYSELGVLMEKYKLYRVGPMMAIFYDDYRQFDYNNADIEVCMPVAGELSQCPNIRMFGDFLGVTMFHRGEYDKMPESYGMALKWIEQNGYEFIGAAAEKYIIDPAVTEMKENYITQIIMPVKKT